MFSRLGCVQKERTSEFKKRVCSWRCQLGLKMDHTVQQPQGVGRASATSAFTTQPKESPCHLCQRGARWRDSHSTGKERAHNSEWLISSHPHCPLSGWASFCVQALLFHYPLLPGWIRWCRLHLVHGATAYGFREQVRSHQLSTEARREFQHGRSNPRPCFYYRLPSGCKQRSKWLFNCCSVGRGLQ